MFIVGGGRREGKSVRGGRGREERQLRGGCGGGLQPLDDICSEVRRYAANYLGAYIGGGYKIFVALRRP